MLKILKDIERLSRDYDNNYSDILESFERLKGYVQQHRPKWLRFYYEFETAFNFETPFQEPIIKINEVKTAYNSKNDYTVTGHTDMFEKYVKELYEFPKKQRKQFSKYFHDEYYTSKHYNVTINKINMAINMLDKWGKMDFSDAGVDKYVEEIGV